VASPLDNEKTVAAVIDYLSGVDGPSEFSFLPEIRAASKGCSLTAATILVVLGLLVGIVQS
jgi:hypothetical protein